MATPDARRIAFGTSATARIEAATTDMRVTREDGTAIGNYDSDKVILDTTIAKRFGGKDHTLRDDTEDCNFIYVKNTGSTRDARLILDGTEPDILIPPGASVSLRLNSVASANIKVDAEHSDGTTIEYVLAKE